MNVQVRTLGTFQTVKLQNIVFDGTTTLYNLLTMAGAAPNIQVSSDLLVSLDGVIQNPDVAYTASSNQIQFTTAPTADALNFIVWFSY